MNAKKSTLQILTAISSLSVKALFFSLLFLSLSSILMSQSKEMSVSPLRFAGVHALGSIQGQNDAFMVIQTAPEGNWNFQLLNNDLHEIKNGQIEAPRYSFFNGVISNGEYILMSFLVNAFSQSATYVVLDMQGKEVARHTREDVTMLRRGDHFFPGIYNHPTEGFVIVQTIGGGRRAGYAVEHVDHNLNTLWRKEFPSTRGHIHVYDLVADGAHLYILEATERMGNTLNARLHCISLTENEHIYTRELSDQLNSFFPTAFLPGTNGGITMAGTFFRGEKIQGKNTRGIFMMSLDTRGQTSTLELHPWSGLRSTLRTPVPDWFFRVMPDVYIHALEPGPGGSVTAIAELYRYSGEVRREEREGITERYHRIRMLDFMLFDFDHKGELLSTKRIQRPHMVLKLDSESVGGSSGLAYNAGKGPLRRARAMKQGGAFTYRFHQKTDRHLHLGFMSYEDKSHHAYIMTINGDENLLRVSLRHAKPAVISYLQVIDLLTNQSGFGFILSELNTRSFDDSEAYWRGIFPISEGIMLTYEYFALTGKLNLNIVNMHNAAVNEMPVNP